MNLLRGLPVILLGAIGAPLAGFTAPPRVYYVWVSPEFTPEEAHALERAEDAWQEAVGPGLVFLPWVSDDCDVGMPRSDERICVAPASHAWLADLVGNEGIIGVQYRPTGEGIPIQVRVDVGTLESPTWRAYAPELGIMRHVFAHELGHARGLDHDLSGHSIMRPAVLACLDPIAHTGCDVAVPLTPTTTDAMHWRLLRLY